MHDSLKQKAVKGVAWTAIDQATYIGLNFVIGVILARLLSPSEFGLLAMIAVFNAIAQAFLDSGFGAALIRKPQVSEADRSTAFYFNIIAGAVLFGVLFLAAPFIAQFYAQPILQPLVRWEAFLLVIAGFNIVQQAQLSRDLNFKAKAIIRASSTLLSGGIAILAAYRGAGVWSLVLMHIAFNAIQLVMLWLMSPWRPHSGWSRQSFSYLWGFGSKMLASSVIDKVYMQIYPIVIGKFFTPADLGQYARASQYAQLPSHTMTNVIQQVTFPVLSQIQQDGERLSSSYRRILRLSAFLIFPVMIALAALARPLVVALVTDKWLPCVPYLQLICFASMWFPIHAINLNLLQVKGRSDLFLRLEIIKKVIVTVVMFCSVPFGIIAMCLSRIVTSLLCLFINTYYTGKLINVGFAMQMRDLLPTLINSLVMGAIIYFVTLPLCGNWLQLIVGFVVGTAYYLTSTRLLRFPELSEALSIIRRK